MKIFLFITFHTQPLHIRFDKIDEFIRIYDGNRYSVLLGLEKHDAYNNRIRHFITQKSGITHVFSHYYAKVKVDSFNSKKIGIA